MFQQKAKIEFPSYRGRHVNMLPIIAGEPQSLPDDLRDYSPMVNACGFEHGDTVYLTVHESAPRGHTQRRSGVHIESPAAFGWGGGWGGQKLGLFMASTDGACRVWDTLTFGDSHGACEKPSNDPEKMDPSRLYWLTDRTPHESLVSTGRRQYFRLVSREIGGWWREHNTPNPTGVTPKATILHGSKF